MAKVLPVKGIRPSKDRAATIAALPYDVYNRSEAEAVVAQNPDSFLAVDRAETNFDSSVGTYDEVVYQKVLKSMRILELKRKQTEFIMWIPAMLRQDRYFWNTELRQRLMSW